MVLQRPGTSLKSKKSSSSWGQWGRLVKNRVFLFLFAGWFFEGFGYYYPFFFLPKYITDLNLGSDYGALVLGIVNGMSGIGRIVVGRLSDSIGALRAFLYCVGTSTLLVWVWPACTTRAEILAWGIIFGFHIGGYVSLQSPIMAKLFGVEGLAEVIGILYSASVPGALLGPVIAGWLLDMYEPDVKPSIFFSASSFAIGFIFLCCCVFFERKQHQPETVVIITDTSENETSH